MPLTAIEYIKERLKIISNVITKFEPNEINLIPILHTNTEVLKDDSTNIREVITIVYFILNNCFLDNQMNVARWRSLF